MADLKTVARAGAELISSALIVIATTIVLFGLLELGLALAKYPRFNEFDSVSNARITDVTPSGGVSYKPNITNALPGYPGALSTDGMGFIHNGQARISRADIEGAVFVFGGSTVEGRGASSNSTTIAAHLEACLQGVGIGRPVVNAGFSGDYSYQEFQRAVDAIGRYRPSILIFIDGRNDAHYAQLAEWQPFDSNPGIHPPFDYLNKASSRSPWERIFHDGRAVSRIVNLAFNLRARSVPGETAGTYIDPGPGRVAAAAVAYLTIHDAIHSIGATHGIPVYTFLQPTPAVGARKPTPDESERMREFISREGVTENYFVGVGRFYQAVLARGDSRITDLTGLFDRVPTSMYVDSVHYNDESNRLIAQKICGAVKGDSALARVRPS